MSEHFGRKRKGIGTGATVGITILVFAAMLAYPIYYGVDAYYTGVQFNNQIGGYFDLADQASNATVKLHYWNEFGAAIKAYGLNNGESVAPGGWPKCACIQNPEYNLTNTYNTNFLTIQSRLQSLVASCPVANITCQSSFAYTQSLNQIETTEICWFPIDFFQEGYTLHYSSFGGPLPFAGWAKPSNSYLCPTVTTTW